MVEIGGLELSTPVGFRGETQKFLRRKETNS